MASEFARWDDLLAAAKCAGFGDEFLRNLRWTTLAPSELHDFRELLRKLRGVLKRAEKAWPGVLKDLGIFTWPAKLKRLERRIKQLTFPHIPHEQRHVANAGVNDGIRQRHAIYADLLAIPEEDSDYADERRLLWLSLALELTSGEIEDEQLRKLSGLPHSTAHTRVRSTKNEDFLRRREVQSEFTRVLFRGRFRLAELTHHNAGVAPSPHEQ